MRHRSLILGANGQDGQILVSQLLKNDDEVYALGRQEFFCRDIISNNIEYQQIDLARQDCLEAILKDIRPTRVFHLAAVHGSAQNNAYEAIFCNMLDVNVKTVHTILEFQRHHLETQLIYASSGKVFGSPLPVLVDENTPQFGSCLYSISKIIAGNLIAYYRRNHHVRAAIYYLFNHESQFRGGDFFISKLVQALGNSIKDKSHKVKFRTLNFYCDWGSAEEYMKLVTYLSETAETSDLIIATGKTVFARELVRKSFEKYDLNYQNHIIEEDLYREPPEKFRVDISNLKKFAIAPTTDIFKIVHEMVG